MMAAEGSGTFQFVPPLLASGSWERWRVPTHVLIVASFVLAVRRVVEAARARATAWKWAAIARRRAAHRDLQVCRGVPV
jgi:hypothetical protein